MSHIKFRDLLKEVLLVEVSLEQLKQQFVDTEKVSQEIFDEVVEASGGKSAYATWLLSKVEQEIIKAEDIYKYKDYIQAFDKYKRAYPKQDINQYKTFRDIDAFISKSIEILDMQEKDGEGGTEGTENLLSPTQVKSLQEVGIKYLGTVEGYQCFEVPSTLKGNKEAHTRYKNLLGQCSGGSIHICTIASQNHFDRYLESGPFYLFFNLKDPQSPYQFHYESNQFMDREDRSVI